MKKLTAWLLALILLAGSAALGEKAMDHLTVGNTTALSGNFTSRMWGYNTSDLDVSALVNGYNLIRWNYELGNFEVDDSVVDSLTVNVNEDEGSCTYLIRIKKDLMYSDGTPITAADYVFSVLLNTCPQAESLGGNTDGYASLAGMKEFRSGASRGIAGLRMPDAYSVSMTVATEYRPFFYELGLLRCDPMPVHVIAPGCSVVDDEGGAYIDGPFTAELLQKTLLDAETGYLSHPSVVSGPYKVTSFDAATSVAEFEINENYKGNSAGIKPSIRTLTLKPAENGTMIAELKNGSFGLLDKCLDSETIGQGLELIGEGGFAMSAYPRSGMSFLSCNCEKGPVARQAVRQAIACCLDKDETVNLYTGTYGLRVDGYYGIGQWMYRVLNGYTQPPVEAPAEGASEAEQARYDAEMAKWAALSLDGMKIWPHDPEEAVRLLEEDGWTLNREGKPFDAAKDDIRCRMEDGELQALELTLIWPEGNRIGEILEQTFLPALKQAGIGMTMKAVEWHELLKQYYRQEARDCDLIYLASNFYEVFNPWPVFDPADADTGASNYTGIRDEELFLKAKELSRTEPGNTYEYMVRWIAFQERYAEVLPAIPIYSNVYYDFYTNALQDYAVQQNMTWTEAIVGARLEKPAEEPAEETREEPAQD